MAFENIKTDFKPSAPQTEPFQSPIIDLRNMISRVEHRAIQATRKTAFGDFMGGVIIDPYATYHPSDSAEWLEILSEAKKLDADIYAKLYYVRGGGTVLIPDPKFGFVFQPVIGKNGWSSRQLYGQATQLLNTYAAAIMRIIAEVGSF
ncbi:hypothetical protein SDC9_37456 [bioreactor metagenome]|uniref:Uncharacterized protein n=1 Tax=bioreactor metagenome TaxID=1076179 RepID=A0A644VJ66_9ZZZZ|nr:hypothetical protein [Acidaminococcaceae bacterium]